MSGARLCALLGELGYEGAEGLDPDSFEWPFQYEDARPILDWICSSLRPSNVLSLSELSQYEQFMQEGKLLEGEDLDFAYDSISAFSARRDNQEAVFGTEEGLKDIRYSLDSLMLFTCACDNCTHKSVNDIEFVDPYPYDVSEDRQ